MRKDAYWFSHDYEPVGDPKIQALLNDYGGLGYGIFWRIAEMLHSEPEHKLPFKKYIFLAIAKQMQANGKQNISKSFLAKISDIDIQNFVSDCVSEYELFQSDDLFFWSNRVIRNIDKKDKVSSIRALVGREGGKAKAIAKQIVVNGNQTEAIAYQNVAIKGKERKEEYINGSNSTTEFTEVNDYNTKIWRRDCSTFLKDTSWKEQFCMHNKIEFEDLEKSMKEFVSRLNLQEDFKNVGGLKKHYTNHYNKHGLVVSEFEEKKKETRPKIKLS